MNDKKKILFIEKQLAPDKGGVEKVTHTISRSLQQRGYIIYYAYSTADDPQVPIENKLHFSINQSLPKLKQHWGKFIEQHQINTIICQNIQTYKFQQLYKYLKEKYNIYFLTCLHANPDIWINKNKIGCTTWKIYLKELLRSFIFKISRNPYKERCIRMYNITDKYILLSESFIPIFKQLYHVDGKKLVAIPNPSSFNYEYKFQENKENTILVVSRIAEQQKRISNIIYIWEAIYKKYPNWKLQIVGEGSDLNYYSKYIQKKKIERVYFEGQQKETSQYYQKAKIFLMTSIWEGQPMTLLESMHNGCIPIVFDTFASLHDIIINKQNGIIIPFWNIDLYITELKYLIETPKVLKQMQQNAAASMKNKFSIESITNQWEQILREQL